MAARPFGYAQNKLGCEKIEQRTVEDWRGKKMANEKMKG
jgi:hypothetical protein